MRFIFFYLISLSAFAADKTPDLGHDAQRLGLDTVYNAGLGAGVGLNYRYGLHDFLDRQTGYPEHTQMELGGVRFQFFPSTSQIFIDELNLFRIARLRPFSSSWEELSWKFEVGGRRLRNSSCNRCGAANVAGGLGAAWKPVDSLPATLWVLAEAELLGSPDFSGFFIKPSLGPRFGARFSLTPWLNGGLYGLVRWQAGSPYLFFEAGTQWRASISRNWAVQLQLQRYDEGWETLGGLFTYF